MLRFFITKSFFDLSDSSHDEFEEIMRRYPDIVQSEDEDEDESQRSVHLCFILGYLS